MRSVAVTKTIDIRTAIPGPRSREILERKARVIANAKTIAIPIVAQEGRGATLTDVDGNKLTIAFDKAGEKKVVDSFVERV